MKAYDFIGNPCNYRGYVIQWSRGKLLSRFGEHIYSYNADGVRYKKTTASGVVHTYHLEGTRIHKEQRGNVAIYYIYDESGIVGMNYNGSKYYFQKNLQGDVVRIYNASGVENTSATFIGNINPFRYRGYYFDGETGLFMAHIFIRGFRRII